MFYSFTINYQSKLKKTLAYYSWDIYQEKLATKFAKVSGWVFWVGDHGDVLKSLFFVKNYYLNLNFLQVLQSTLFKYEKLKKVKQQE